MTGTVFVSYVLGKPSTNIDMNMITDKEIYLIEEIDVCIKVLRDIHLSSLGTQIDVRQESKLELVKWYEEYLMNNLQ